MDKPQGSVQYLTDMDIRIWLRDKEPTANLLLDDYEFSPEEIRTAQTLAVDFWNDRPPEIRRYDYDKFPWRSSLLTATAANLLFMAAHRYRRNDLTYSAGEVSVADQAKYQQYDAAASRLWAEYKEWVDAKKRELNVAQGFGMV